MWSGPDWFGANPCVFEAVWVSFFEDIKAKAVAHGQAAAAEGTNVAVVAFVRAAAVSFGLWAVIDFGQILSEDVAHG